MPSGVCKRDVNAIVIGEFPLGDQAFELANDLVGTKCKSEWAIDNWKSVLCFILGPK
jgi:hypothetical protein